MPARFCSDPRCFRECRCSRWPDLVNRFGEYVRPREDEVEPNGLLNALIAYWPGNEATGDALDLHTNSLTLTQTSGTITASAGLVYPTARQYIAADTEYHARPGDDALLSAGNNDLTIAAWVYLDSIGAARGVYNKLATAGQYEYNLSYSHTATRFTAQYSHDGTALTTVTANTLGVPAITTWYLIISWHDSVANTINIQVNNGGVDSAAFNVAGVFNGTDPFLVGRTGANYWNGRIGPTAFWKSAGGGGGVLTAAQRTALYNGGAGLTYAQLTT